MTVKNERNLKRAKPKPRVPFRLDPDQVWSGHRQEAHDDGMQFFALAEERGIHIRAERLG